MEIMHVVGHGMGKSSLALLDLGHGPYCPHTQAVKCQCGGGLVLDDRAATTQRKIGLSFVKWG